ncbi:hypothetical protein PSEUBRA_002530 [Kalmanozyma brasiliensis GHG001]|uniref:Uncharacterized protein n=1 Tax=Kalmanozyma brasiliensis (strain GHG001) TaxID=1365824 RepID=V5EXX6_KALBG|nr:uncharacterized protein PSEUBRA_002530 [Kalmanozyma brasiliensis GHG001]EST07454.1 hypothetical protein PSEUBRA_002530 [Kalmanozyma brasiliensis GHG001]
MSIVPSDEALTEQIKLILTKAHENDTIGDHTKRKVREMLTDYFDACLESPKTKKKVNAMVMEQNDLIAKARQQQGKGSASTSKAASTSKFASPVKAAATSRPASPVKAASKSAKAKTPKRKRASAAADSDSDNDAEAAHKAPTGPVGVSSDTEPASDDFSELEEDTSTSRVKKSRTTTSKKSASSSAPKRKSTAKPSGSEAEQRLTRLKKLVSECGVHKQWKRLYEAANVDATDFDGQSKIVQGVLRELGMTGKGSLEQARKIREEREFNEELAALQENEVVGKTRGSRQTRASLGESAKRSKTIEISDTEESGSEFDEAPPKKSARKAVSDSDEDEDEDDGPAPKKSFNKSLASFVADINSDSD